MMPYLRRRRRVIRRAYRSRVSGYVKAKKRPTYGRLRRKSKMTSRRRILNVSSIKKRDNMLTAYRSIPNNTVISPQFLISATGLQCQTFIFSPTMRWGSQQTDKFEQINTRSSQESYVRGFKERLRFVTSDGNPWTWRRICFSYYDSESDFKFFDTSDDTEKDYPPFTYDNVYGYHRLWMRLNGPATTIQENKVRGDVYSHVFRGKTGIDWTSELSAPTNPLAVKIWYDKTTTIRSGNEQSTMKFVPRWHSIGKRLIYSDRDAGGGQDNSYSSETSRVSMGDYMILDIFASAPNDEGVQLSIGSDATYYWHER